MRIRLCGCHAQSQKQEGGDMRNLASIQTIKSLEDIPNKDRIKLCSFENTGWHVIVGTDLKVGDMVVYCEVDAVLPVKPEFEFLRPRCWNNIYQGFRIRSMKMSNIYSEGIVFPLSILPAGNYKEGQDVTDLIGVIKYDSEALEESKQVTKKKYGPFMRFLFRFPFLKAIFLPKKVRSKWPEFVAYTDETRVQNLTYVFEKYQGLPVYVTVKRDGQSATYFYNKKEFGVCSRNLRLPSPAKNKGNYAGMQSRYWENARRYDIENKLKQASKDMGINLYIQGEQCGPGIQGNKYQYKELKLFIFNIYDITHKRYFSWEQMKKFCETYSFDMVPFVEYIDFLWKDVDELIVYAKGNDPDGDNMLREGVVIRSVIPMPPDEGMANMWSLKVVNLDFLIKYGANDFSDKGTASGTT